MRFITPGYEIRGQKGGRHKNTTKMAHEGPFICADTLVDCATAEEILISASTAIDAAFILDSCEARALEMGQVESTATKVPQRNLPATDRRAIWFPFSEACNEVFHATVAK